MAVTTVATQQRACPWCGQGISPAQFVLIENRIRKEMEERAATAAAELRSELEGRFKIDKTTLELQRDTAREELAKANEEKASAERQLKEAREAERKKVETELGEKRDVERKQEREIYDAELKAERVKAKAEDQAAVQALQKQVADLERALAEHAASKPEVIDIDLLEELKAAYKDDRVVRLPEPEVSDIIIDVKSRNQICGRILIDSRPRAKWLAQYGNKLADDLAEQKAQHAILATEHMPKKSRAQLARHGDEVLVVHPVNVVEIVGILRQSLIQAHRAKLTEEKRADKKQELYAYITSPTFMRKLADVGKLTRELETIDADEKKEHDRVWKKRGLVREKIADLNKSLTNGLNDIVLGIQK